MVTPTRAQFVMNLIKAAALLCNLLFVFVMCYAYYHADGSLARDWTGYFFPAAQRYALGQPVYASQYLFYNPPPFLLPLIALTPLGWLASSLAWCGLSLLLLLAVMPFTLWASGWYPTWRQLVITGCWVVGFTPSLLETVVFGQATTPVVFSYALGFWLLRRGTDGWAGSVLALTLIKPQLSFLILPLLLYKRRWRAVLGYLTAAALVTGLTAVLFGPHLYEDYWQAQRAIARIPFTLDGLQPDVPGLHGMLLQLWPHNAIANDVAVGLSLVLILLLAWHWRSPWRPESERFVIGWGLLAVCTLLIAPYAHTYDAVLLVFPLLVLYALLRRRASRSAPTRLPDCERGWLLVALIGLYVSTLLRMFAKHHFMVPAMTLALIVLWRLPADREDAITAQVGAVPIHD